jgi:hypothetical protein
MNNPEFVKKCQLIFEKTRKKSVLLPDCLIFYIMQIALLENCPLLQFVFTFLRGKVLF